MTELLLLRATLFTKLVKHNFYKSIQNQQLVLLNFIILKLVRQVTNSLSY
jgi:hypothetical protein